VKGATVASIRLLAFLALTAALFVVSVPLPAGAVLDQTTKQVMIQATIVSVDYHDQMALGLEWLGPNDRLDPSQTLDMRNLATNAQDATTIALGLIETEPGFASSPNGQASLGLLNDALLQQDVIIAALDANAKVKLLSRPNLAALNDQVAAIELFKYHPIGPGNLDGELRKKEAKAVGQFYDSAQIFRDVLQQYGIATNPLAGLFEGFEGGKKNDILARLQLGLIENLKVKPKKGDLVVQGTEKEPSNASVVLSTGLPGDFTTLSSFQLPEKLSNKQRQALENFSFGFELASDLGSPPAEYAGFEVQTTPNGVAQGFTFANGSVLDIFPIDAPMISTRTAVTNVAIKDGSNLTIGGIFEYENGQMEMQTTQIPSLGDLPVLRLFFRNMSKKNSLRNKDLLIFITPKVITVP
jgi:hypothetical protein